MRFSLRFFIACERKSRVDFLVLTQKSCVDFLVLTQKSCVDFPVLTQKSCVDFLVSVNTEVLCRFSGVDTAVDVCLLLVTNVAIRRAFFCVLFVFLRYAWLNSLC